MTADVVAIMTAETNLPLTADVQYMEPYGSLAFNRKLKGILLPGFFAGFNPVPGAGLELKITSPASGGTASVDVNGSQISVQQHDDVSLELQAGVVSIIALEANYAQGVKTTQVDSSSSVPASQIIGTTNEALADNQIELCRVNIPAGATQIDESMIDLSHRINRGLGIQLSSEIDSDRDDVAASSHAVKKLHDMINAIEIPEGTTSQPGLVQLSSATDSDSETLAATPKAVKAAYDLAKGKYTAQDASTEQKGIVQLSSATDSDSEVLAATPKAVSGAIKEIKSILGTASGKDVVTSKTDYTAGRVLTTGWMSLGGYGTDNLIAAADAKKSLRNGFYAVSNEPAYGNSSLISFGYDSGSQVHIIAKQGGQAPLLGVCGSTPQGDFGNWGKIYTEFQKPTALDVGAVPYRGQLGTDDLNTVTGTNYGRFCQGSSANATAARNYPITEAGSLDVHQTFANGAEGCVQEYRTFNSRRIFLRTYNPDGATWTDWCEYYTTAKKPTAADVGAIPLTGSTSVTGLVRNSAEFQSTSANSFRIAYGGYGAFWRQDGANLYLMLTNNGDQYGGYNSLRPLTINMSTGNSTMGRLSLTDWTNFDARYLTLSGGTVTGATNFNSTLNVRAGLELYAPQPFIDFHFGNSSADYTTRLIENTSGNLHLIGSFSASQTITPGNYSNFDARYSLKNTASKTANSMYSKDSSTGVIEVAMSNITVAKNSSASVTFPIAFPTACVSVVIAYDGAERGSNADSSYAVTSYTRTGCVINVYNASGKFMLIAKGY